MWRIAKFEEGPRTMWSLLVPKPPQSGRTSQLVAGLRVPDDHQVVDIEDQGGGAVRCVARETRFCGSSKPKNCFTSRKQTSRGQRRENVVRMSGGVCVRSVEKKQSSWRRCEGSRTTTIRSSLWPALEYHKASTDLYQTRTRLP